MIATAVLLCQSILSFTAPSEPTPIRFGIPIPRGSGAGDLMLRLSGVGGSGSGASGGVGSAFQWSELLPGTHSVAIRGRRATARVWVEVAIDRASGPLVLRRARGSRGVSASVDRSGAALRFERPDEIEGQRSAVAGRTERRIWHWRHTRLVDRVERMQVALGPIAGGDGHTEYSPGEWLTQVAGRPNRADLVAIPPAFWRKAGVLPNRDFGIGIELREALLAAVGELRRAPGARGRGDYIRGGGATDRPVVCTNLEFDTTLGFLRLGLISGRGDLLRRGYESAYHLIDRDLDTRSGLPFCHGIAHRISQPELGHCWLRGLLLAGCLFADRVLLEAAIEMGRAIAARVLDAEFTPTGLARDVGCPLLELESLLRVVEIPKVVSACDRLGQDLLRRWDDRLGVFLFQEGRLSAAGREASYKERCWQTAGIVLPGLRMWTERSRSSRGRECLRRTERRLVGMLRRGREGVPLRYLVGPDGRTFGELRRSGTAAACLMLEGLSIGGLRRVWSRSQVRRAFSGVPDLKAHDLVTEFSLAARCDWVYR